MKRLVDTYSDEAMWRQVVATLQADEPSSAKWRQVVAKFDDGAEAPVRALVQEVSLGSKFGHPQQAQDARSTALLPARNRRGGLDPIGTIESNKGQHLRTKPRGRQTAQLPSCITRGTGRAS